MTDFVIRRATAGDRAQVVRLVSEMFDADVSARYDWLYRDNPHGPAVTWLAFEHNEPALAVALTSVFPRKVSVAGRDRMGSIGGDCYVMPRARRRGLATLLHRTCFAEMRAAGVDFMYGPPLPNNLQALLKAGSSEVGVYRRFSRPLTGDAAAKAVSASATAGKLANLSVALLDRVTHTNTERYTISEVTRFDEEFDTLAKRAEPPGAVCPVRDAAFLAWRYLAPQPRPQVPLAIRAGDQLVAFAAYEARDDEAIIVDVFGRDAKATAAAIQLLVDRARTEGRARIDYYVTPGSLRAAQLTRRGFVGRDDRVFQVATTSAETQLDVLCDPASWYVTEGDKDMPTCFSDEPV